MLPTHEIQIFLQRVPTHLQDIVLELRSIIISVSPDAVEVIRWGGISYFHEGRGGIVSAGICQIGIHDTYVRLDFIHGIHLSDPKQLLEGAQKSKRFIKLKSYDDAPWDDLKQLIEESSHFDPRSLPGD
ncbi:MAG: DUF1801 domain-containing protein [Anaerolineales bacterium]